MGEGHVGAAGEFAAGGAVAGRCGAGRGGAGVGEAGAGAGAAEEGFGGFWHVGSFWGFGLLFFGCNLCGVGRSAGLDRESRSPVVFEAGE